MNEEQQKTQLERELDHFGMGSTDQIGLDLAGNADDQKGGKSGAGGGASTEASTEEVSDDGVKGKGAEQSGAGGSGSASGDASTAPTTPSAELMGALQQALPGLELPGDADMPTVINGLLDAVHGSMRPEAMALNKALMEGKTLEQFFQQQGSFDRLLEMDDEPLVRNFLEREYGIKSDENPNGLLTKEKLDGMLAAMKNGGTLEMQALEYRKKLQHDKVDHQKAMSTPAKSRDLRDKEVAAQYVGDISKRVDDLLKVDSFMGFDLSKPEAKAKMKESAVKLFTPNEYGVAPAHQYFNKQAIEMVLAYDMMKNGALQSAKHDGREAAKGIYKDLLDLIPPTKPSSNERPGGGTLTEKQELDIFGQPIATSGGT